MKKVIYTALLCAIFTVCIEPTYTDEVPAYEGEFMENVTLQNDDSSGSMSNIGMHYSEKIEIVADRRSHEYVYPAG